jgi:hypothetical protein
VSEEVLEAIVLTEGIEEVGPLDFAVVDCVDEFVVVEGLCDEQGDEGVGREDLVEGVRFEHPVDKAAHVGREFEWGSVLEEDGEVIDAMCAIEASSLADVRMDEVFEGVLLD